ncbi:hypothetical protein [Rahnella sp. ChDrAdgB13]|uniref:hypothetical protein n=1 Tax=Rahnella sp. ChDrAdgB13 TaxID=1850581 RepID=UPI001AD8875A|nr:hypothetical protein [Rahnella sp. ChDrAdgB13]
MRKRPPEKSEDMRAVLLALRDITEKLDAIDARLDAMDDEGIKRGTVAGTLSGAVSGAMVAVGMALVRATAGG